MMVPLRMNVGERECPTTGAKSQENSSHPAFFVNSGRPLVMEKDIPPAVEWPNTPGSLIV
jgi:hypothetical protein